MRLFPLWVALAAVLLAALAAQRSDAAGLRLGKVAGGFDGALYATSPPGDPRVFVVEQGGRILIVRGGRARRRPFLDISRLTRADGERGLLGLAFHPDYARNGRFYVDYTNRAGDTRVVEYRVSGDPNRANPRSARRLLAVHQPFANHNGGQLAFGPDRMLYVGLGDGGSGGDPFGNGQRLDTLLGKILRIDVGGRSGGRPYAIPSDNPFLGRARGRPEIYAYGLRNPWRFSFDRDRGDLWIGDVGEERWEEIDHLSAGRAAGANFGWNLFEGRHRYAQYAAGARVIGPVAEYSHAKGCSVTGGYVYRGRAVPALRGRYVYGDFCTNRVWTLNADGRPGPPRDITRRLRQRLDGIRSFGENAAGELYLVTGSTLFRFVAG